MEELDKPALEVDKFCDELRAFCSERGFIFVNIVLECGIHTIKLGHNL